MCGGRSRCLVGGAIILEHLEAKLKGLLSRSRDLRAGLRSLPQGLAGLEGRLSGLPAKLRNLETKLRRLETGFTDLPTKLRHLEPRPKGLESRLRDLAAGLWGLPAGPTTRKGGSMATREGKSTVGRFYDMPWTEIRDPGAYVSSDSGRLFRIPESALKEGHSPLIEVVGPKGEEVVTRLSTNPYTPIDKLRLLSADANVEPKF